MYLEKLIISEDIVKYLSKSFSSEDTCDILKVLCNPPLFTTLRVNTDFETREQTIKLLTEELKKQYEDRNLRQADVYAHPILNDLIIIENRGPQTVEENKMKVIVDMTCGEAVLRGADVFAQGLLAAPNYLKIGDLVSVYADREGRCLRGFQKTYEGDTVHVGNGVACMDRQVLFGGLLSNKVRGLAIKMIEPIYEAPSLQPLEALGTSLFAQNLPSVICGHVMDVRPGQFIVDMCAAPGGKTGHLATMINNQGRIIALDKSKSRVKRMKESLTNWKSTCVETYSFDSTKLIQEEADIEGGPPYPLEVFDRVLVDAPCSALGQRPSLKNKIKLCEIMSFPRLQSHLLDVAVKAVKPDGYIIYSTCSIPIEENENQVHNLLNKFPEIELVHQTPHLGGKGRINSELSSLNCDKVQYFNGKGDSVNDDTICFFIAKFKKIKSLINKND